MRTKPNRTVREQRGDLAAEAYRKVRALIIAGHLSPGTRLIEVDVAARLGMSRTPVRSALHRLRQEGYITVTGGERQSRMTIAPLTRDDAHELFSIVGEIEGLAAYHAAALPRPERVALVTRLQQLNAAMAESAGDPEQDPARTAECDALFHRCYLEAGAGPRLTALHDAIKPQADRYIQLYYTALTSEVATSLREHTVIIRGIKAGDPDAARLAVRTNWQNAANRLNQVIADRGERGNW